MTRFDWFVRQVSELPQALRRWDMKVRRSVAAMLYPAAFGALEDGRAAILELTQGAEAARADEEHWRRMCDVHAQDVLQVREEHAALLQRLYAAAKPEGWTGPFASDDAFEQIETRKAALKALVTLRNYRITAGPDGNFLEQEKKAWAEAARLVGVELAKKAPLASDAPAPLKGTLRAIPAAAHAG